MLTDYEIKINYLAGTKMHELGAIVHDHTLNEPIELRQILRYRWFRGRIIVWYGGLSTTRSGVQTVLAVPEEVHPIRWTEKMHPDMRHEGKLPGDYIQVSKQWYRINQIHSIYAEAQELHIEALVKPVSIIQRYHETISKKLKIS